MFRFPCAIRSSLIAVVLVSALCSTARAIVTVTGDVLPADNLATSPAIEGIPSAGNSYNPGVAPNMQNRWENNEVVPGYADINAGIIVGQKLPLGGRMSIDGTTGLRYQTLVIGDQGTVGGQLRKGDGTVLITGAFAFFSNDPNSLPPGLPPNFASLTPRATDVGFDLYVGRFGQGRLELRDGGRAEIQDAVIVGDQPGSIGRIEVDGFGSLLASGGFDGGPLGSEAHQMIIGRLSQGFLTITNSGTVVTESVAGSTGDTVVAAVIGSDVFIEGDIPEPGGNGTVTVTGAGSQWIIGGSLQIGGFHDSLQGVQTDFSGTNVQYNSEAGRGTLHVDAGGFVSIRAALDSDPEQDDLVLAIGRYGRLELSGGLVSIGSPSDSASRQDTVQVLNDGVITGSGRIETGVFRNRYVGEVRVNAGHSLIIDSSSEFVGAALDDEPLANWGVMRILGTEDQRAHLEFERAPDTVLDPIQPFRNLRVERPTGAPLGDFYGGLISAQHSTLIFRSGLENSGMVAFTDGMNYIAGNVVNLAADPMTPADFGIIRVWGSNTRAVFENDLINGGSLSIMGGASVDVLERHSFVTSGELMVEIDPSRPSPLSTAGDVGIAGALQVNLINVSPGSISLGDTFEIISFGGDIGGVDLSDPLRPKVDLAAAPLFSSFLLTPSLASLGLAPGLVIIPEFTLNSVILAVRSTVGFIGPDFNGDGVVNAQDLAIWKANKGITMGATVLQGDANGDGAVDGADYLIWLEEFTMGPGSGGGGFESPSGTTVPEPTGLALLAIGGLLAAAFRRRRG